MQAEHAYQRPRRSGQSEVYENGPAVSDHSVQQNEIESEGGPGFPGIAVASWVKIAMSKSEIGIPFCEKASGSFDLIFAMCTKK